MPYRLTDVTVLSALAIVLAAVFALPTLSALAEEAEEEAQAEQQKQEWLVWAREALEQAQETGKPILANFTGSDWCPPCMQQEERVFQSDEFKQWASENVVLLELDFPRQKEQPEDLKAQNQQLAEHFGIRGFPTVMVLTSEGREVERFHYNGSDAEAWIEQTQRHVDEAIAQAEAEEDEEAA